MRLLKQLIVFLGSNLNPTKLKRIPGDCLIFFNSREMNDLILKTNQEKKLCIEEKFIIIYKETPKRFLKQREPYKGITQTEKEWN